MTFRPDAVAAALRESWSLETARQWTAENPAAGQCNVTHRWHSLRLHTASQFDRPITYADILTDREDAERGVTQLQVAALRKAFQGHFGRSA
jgi:hypothetical protein